MRHNSRNSAKITSLQNISESQFRERIIQAIVSVLLEERGPQLNLFPTGKKPAKKASSSESKSFIDALDSLLRGEFVRWGDLMPTYETSFSYRTLDRRGPGEHRLAKILRGKLSPTANASYDIEVNPETLRGEYQFDSEDTLRALHPFKGHWEVKSVKSNLILMGTGTAKESTRICNDYVQICDQLIKYYGALDQLVRLKKGFESLSASKRAVSDLEDYVAKARVPAKSTTINTVEIDVLFSNSELRSKTLEADQIDSIFRKSIMDILNPTDNDVVRAAVLTHDAFFKEDWFDKHLKSFNVLDGYPGIMGFFLVDEVGVRMFKAGEAKTKFRLDTISFGGRANIRVGDGNFGWREQ